MGAVIQVENVSKQYRLGVVNSKTFKEDVKRKFYQLIRGRDPYLEHGSENDRREKSATNFSWSLRDIDFEINQGDIVGIVGNNGAGKSTLLKILSRVTTPTSGEVRIKGRVASLLEVGTGFHPELTGKENVFLNGAIMGMSKSEIESKLDEIIEFAGVERYIDTPVKRYSSGMYVRLAFAVAAHLEPEILIVDEVLAVGDIEFQKKCLGKMKDVSAHGRTVLFVSHNIAAIRSFCEKGIYLKNGKIEAQGSIDEVLKIYLESNADMTLSGEYKKEILEGKSVELVSAKVCNEKSEQLNIFEISENIHIHLEINNLSQVPGVYGYIQVVNTEEDVFIESDSKDFGDNIVEKFEIGLNSVKLTISKYVLPIGNYKLYVSFASMYSNQDTWSIDCPGYVLEFSVIDSQTIRGANRRANTSHILYWKKNVT
jgi:lipopolysaccharide transport system ATP-binding protein